MPTRAVLFDFYGTLAEAVPETATLAARVEVLAEHGYTLPAEVHRLWWNDGVDGDEHPEASRSRDDYVAWQRRHTRRLLVGAGVSPDHVDGILERLATVPPPALRAYPETADVLRALSAQGVRLAVCSNWDWDIDLAVEAAGIGGLVDVVVSSARVGARKPHPRIFLHTLSAVGVDPADAIFVGDTWALDVEGPRTLGIDAVYVRRAHRGDDPTAPDRADVIGSGVQRWRDLSPLPLLVRTAG